MSFQDQVKSDLIEIKNILIPFLRHPMTGVKHIPDWPWHRIILLHVLITGSAGVLAALVERKSSFSIIASLIASPILTALILGISTLFFYYCFQIFANQTVSFRKLFTIVLFANIPQFVFQIIAGYVPPITLVGMAFTALLLLVGFVENLHVDRKLVIRLLIALYAIFFALWISNMISNSHIEKTWHSDRDAAPEVQLGQ
jgi:hypothetical protein